MNTDNIKKIYYMLSFFKIKSKEINQSKGEKNLVPFFLREAIISTN